MTHDLPDVYGDHDTRFSPDGTRIAIGFRGKCKVLDLTSGKKLAELEGYEERGVSELSSDGKIVSGFPKGKTHRREAYLWNAADGQVVGRLKAPDDVDVERCTLSFSPDNRKVVSAYSDGLLVWDLADLQQVRRIPMPPSKDYWWHAIVSPNPATREMTGVNAHGKLLKIDLDQGTATPLLPKQEKPVESANWSPDGTRLVTIDQQANGGTIAVWDVGSGEVMATIPETAAYSARFSPHGDRIVTQKPGRPTPTPWDYCTRIWDAKSGALIRELPTTAYVEFSPDWSYWMDPRPDGIRIARFDGSQLQTFPGFFDGHGSGCVFAQDNRHVTYCNSCGHVVVWQLNDPSASWVGWLRRYPFWIAIAAAAGLAWSVKELLWSRSQPPPRLQDNRSVSRSLRRANPPAALCLSTRGEPLLVGAQAEQPCGPKAQTLAQLRATPW